MGWPVRAVVLVCWVAGCWPAGPRETLGPDDEPAAKPRPAQPPAGAVMVAAERYAPGSRLVLLDDEGRRIAELTPPPERASVDLFPAWSPDGRLIAYSSSRGRAATADTSLWLVTPTGDQVRVTDDAGVDLEPAWSPDGKHLAFASTRGGAGLDLFVVDVGWKDGRPTTGVPRLLAGGPGDQHAPAWSPKGDRLACVSLEAGTARLLELDADGGLARILDPGPAAAAPAYAPDGRRLVFSAPPDGARESALYLLDLSSGRRDLLLAEAMVDLRGARFSVDGRALVMTAIPRNPAGAPIYAAVAIIDTAEEKPILRALLPPLAAPRLGVDLAPVAFPVEAIRRAPRFVEAILSTISR
jgi:dipeptidyl aminopeptidase/acylaminoacyl peptidase